MTNHPKLITVACVLWPGYLDKVVRVTIDEELRCSQLKETLLREPYCSQLVNIPPSHIDLWKCSFLLDDDNLEETLKTISFQGDDKRLQILYPGWRLRKYFNAEQMSKDRINVIIELRTHDLLHADPLESSDDLRRRRRNFNWTIKDQPMLAPFVPSVSPKNQADARTIVWSRPSSGCTGSIPVTLYHSVFRRFMDDCKLGPAHPTDNAFALDLSTGMSRIFADGEARATEFRDTFQRNGICLSKSTINSKGAEYITDGDIQVNGNMIVILTVRNELCGSDSEPYGEGILSYMHSTWPATERSTMFNFPCFIITLFGAHISFSGAVWTDRPQCQILSTLPLFYHQTDQDMHIALVRHLGALRKAINSLTQCYLSASSPSNCPKDHSDPCFPDQHQYQSLDSDMPSVVRYHYLRRHHSNKLVFVAKIFDTGEEICVKFVHQYSKTVHEKCTSMGIAPRLWGFENIGGGWKMVVMDMLAIERYIPILSGTRRQISRVCEDLREKLTELHQGANLVHGDVREMNVLVRANGDADYVLIDFDWAGIAGEARYPINVPKGKDLWRPDDAMDGELIMPEHDIVMLDHLCSMHPHGW